MIKKITKLLVVLFLLSPISLYAKQENTQSEHVIKDLFLESVKSYILLNCPKVAIVNYLKESEYISGSGSSLSMYCINENQDEVKSEGLIFSSTFSSRNSRTGVLVKSLADDFPTTFSQVFGKYDGEIFTAYFDMGTLKRSLRENAYMPLGFPQEEVIEHQYSVEFTTVQEYFRSKTMESIIK